MTRTRPRTTRPTGRTWILASMLAVLAAGPAAAQYYGGYGAPYIYNAPPPYPYYGPPPEPAPYRTVRRMRPEAIVDRLEDQGYEDIGRPQVNGGTYMVDATAPGGRRVRLAVDAVRGIVLNTIALGDGPLRRDDDDEDEAPRPGLRYGAEPIVPPYGTLAEDPRRPGRRDTAAVPGRPIGPDGGLPGPADPRLAPGAGAPPAGERREAARSEPPAARPFGANPDAGAPAPRRPATPQARRPAEPASPDRARPEGTTKAAPEPKPATEANARPARPVRVIPGVNPMNSAPQNGEAQLNTLPQPPPVVPPTGTP